MMEDRVFCAYCGFGRIGTIQAALFYGVEDAICCSLDSLPMDAPEDTVAGRRYWEDVTAATG